MYIYKKNKKRIYALVTSQPDSLVFPTLPEHNNLNESKLAKTLNTRIFFKLICQ